MNPRSCLFEVILFQFIWTTSMLHVSSYHHTYKNMLLGGKTSNGQQRKTSCNAAAHVMFDDVLNKNMKCMGMPR